MWRNNSESHADLDIEIGTLIFEIYMGLPSNLQKVRDSIPRRHQQPNVVRVLM